MTLTPEQIAKGWKLHDGSDVCPIKDDRTVHQIHECAGWASSPDHTRASKWTWDSIRAYRIIEAHGADAEPARPTPFPADYSELVFDDAGWSQTIIVDGKLPEWLRADDRCISHAADEDDRGWIPDTGFSRFIAIRVRRREPKRETVKGWLCHVPAHVGSTPVRYDLIDGKPDLSTLKIAENAL